MTKLTMNLYEAEHKKQYFLDNRIVTAKTKLAHIINDEWLYSMHWKKETWLTQAKADIQNRINAVTADLAMLEAGVHLIDQITNGE